MPLVAMTSLSASGTPASGPSSLAGRAAVVDRLRGGQRARRRRRAGTRGPGRRRRRCGRGAPASTSTALSLAAAIAAAVSAAVSRVSVGHVGAQLLVEDARAPGTGRPRPPARRRAPPPRSSAGRTSSARITLVSGSACDVGGMSSAATSATRATDVDDDVELAGEAVELVVGQRQPGQPGEVRDLVAGDRRRAVEARGGTPRRSGHPQQGLVGRARSSCGAGRTASGGRCSRDGAQRQVRHRGACEPRRSTSSAGSAGLRCQPCARSQPNARSRSSDAPRSPRPPRRRSGRASDRDR